MDWLLDFPLLTRSGAQTGVPPVPANAPIADSAVHPDGPPLQTVDPGERAPQVLFLSPTRVLAKLRINARNGKIACVQQHCNMRRAKTCSKAALALTQMVHANKCAPLAC